MEMLDTPGPVTESFSQRVSAIIQKESGLTINSAHKTFMDHYTASRIEELKLSPGEYCNLLERDRQELNRLIDEAAINETYFFREEQQFAFLQSSYFLNKINKEVVIWSAACATGEEPVSLYSLAKASGARPVVYATDIDQKAMDVLRGRCWTMHSFRNDGSRFVHCLEGIGEYYTKNFILSPEVLSKIRLSKFNLVNDSAFPMAPESVDILFIRNVFIYFAPEVRKQVLRKMSQVLKKDGLLFLSINEVASVDCDEETPLVKEHSGSIYYFRKVSLQEKNDKLKAKLLELRRKNREILLNRKKQERLREGVTAAHRKPVLAQQSLESSSTVTSSSTAAPLSLDAAIRKVLSLVDNMDTDGARKTLDSFRFSPNAQEIKLYLEGLIENSSGDEQKAAECYSRASLLNPDFWPASFQLALIYRSRGNARGALNAFGSCHKALKDYIKTQKTCYNNLVESFSPSYFLELCEHYLKK